MCTTILLVRPDHDWPVLLAANRDELASRPARPPGSHWPDREGVVGGLDELGGGSWLALNAYGLVAAVLNRSGTLGPSPGKRSRGEIVLDALDHAEASVAAEALADLAPSAWRPFNLVVADALAAFWVRHDGSEVTVAPIPPGLHMLTSGELDDPSCPRIRRYRPLFAGAATPDPASGDWSDWQLLLGSTSSETGQSRDAMCIRGEGDYGTRSASLLALPADPLTPPVWLHADGPPDVTPFLPIDFGEG